jgi:tetratricopeptide (TPR) repeat protein
MELLEPEGIDASFDATRPRKGGVLGLQALLLLLIFGIMLIALAGPRLGIPGGFNLVLPPLVVAIAVVVGVGMGRRRRQCRRALSQSWQHLQLDEPQPALAALAPIMSGPIAADSERGQAYMQLAGIAERCGRFDAAGKIYESLLLNGIGDLVHLQEAQIKLAYAKLRTDELTDAVNLIGRLAQVPMPGPLKAGFELVHLFQQVFMGHHADAVQQEGERRTLFRKYLSTRAGYGYGLLATAMHYLGRTMDAARLWAEATTLIRREKLVRDLPTLALMSQTYPAVEHPV